MGTLRALSVGVGVLVLMFALDRWSTHVGTLSTPAWGPVGAPAAPVEAAASASTPAPMPVERSTRNTSWCTGAKLTTAEDLMEKYLTPQRDIMLEPLLTKRYTPKGVAYTINDGWWDAARSRVSELVHGVSDADACIEGKARRIDFYGPGGRHLGSADPTQGITVD